MMNNLPNHLPKLSFPPFDYKFKEENGKYLIYDIVRRKFIAFTPEEWVRQHLIHYLINHKQYPQNLFRVEGGMYYNKLSKRADLVVYSRAGKPYLIAECKAPEVKLSQRSFDQVACYNSEYKAPYLLITNGILLLCCKIDNDFEKFEFLKEIPGFDEQ